MISWSLRNLPLGKPGVALLFALYLIGCAAHPAVKASSTRSKSNEDIPLAHDFFLRARSMEMAGRSGVALGYYQVAYRYNSTNRDLCFILLDRLRDAGKIDSAIFLGKNCFRLQGDSTSQQYQSLGQAYLQKDSLRPAMECYREAVKLDDEDRDALYILTGLYEQLGDIPHYAAGLKKLLPLMEYPARLTGKLLQAYQILGQPDSALDVYREILKKSPGNQETLFGYATLAQQQGKPEESWPALNKLVELNPENAMYQYSLGSVGLELRKPESRDALEKAVALEPAIPDYWARAIYAGKVFGKDSLAEFQLAHLPDSTKLGGQVPLFHGMVHVLLARHLEPHQPGEIAHALEDSVAAKNHRLIAVGLFRAALDKNPDDRILLFELGTNLERLGQRDSAVQILTRLVKADTLNPVALNYLGYMLVEDNRDLDFAGKLIDRALALNPRDGAYLDSKGWWCYRKGDLSAARFFLQKALERIPKDPTILKHLKTLEVGL